MIILAGITGFYIALTWAIWHFLGWKVAVALLILWAICGEVYSRRHPYGTGPNDTL